MSKIRIDATSNAYLLNRYLAHVTQRLFNTKGSIKENVVIEERTQYQIQWKNIKADLKALLRNPLPTFPRIAYSLIAFWFIFQGKHLEAHLTAFFMGAIAFDAAAQTSHSGEPATISWSHTIGSGDDRIICIMVSGLSTPNAPLWDGNATTAIVQQDQLRAGYYLAPNTGSANCTADGGNIKVGGSISFSGVDQTDPIGATITNNGGTSPQDISLTTEANNSIRVDACRPNNEDNTSPTASLDSGDLRCNDIVPQNQFRIGLFAYTNAQATAGADTHAWTFSNATTIDFIAYEVKEAVSGGVSGDLEGRMFQRSGFWGNWFS